MTTIDLTSHPERRARAVQRAKERNIIIPTYAQMKDPLKIPAKVKEELGSIGLWDIHPRNLFRINWHNQATASGRTPSTLRHALSGSQGPLVGLQLRLKGHTHRVLRERTPLGSYKYKR